MALGPLSPLPLTCYSGKAASQDAMTANTGSLCQDEAGQRPGQCTVARLLVASGGPAFSLGHILPWHWLVLPGCYLARLSSPAMHLTSSHLCSDHSPIAPPRPTPCFWTSLFIVNHCGVPGELWDWRKREARSQDRELGVQRPTGLLMGVGHSERQKVWDRT